MGNPKPTKVTFLTGADVKGTKAHDANVSTNEDIEVPKDEAKKSSAKKADG